MTRYLNLESWKRIQHFRFFKGYEQPFFNICADVEVDALLEYCRQKSLSFFICYLYLSTKAANAIEEFRYRIRGERVLIHDLVHAGSAVLNADETFGFCYFDYSARFTTFYAGATESLARHAAGHEALEPQEDRDDLIHYSVIPWVTFRSFTNPRKRNAEDSIPKIVFGKYERSAQTVRMPVSVEVHHALMDGLHVGRFFEMFQRFLLEPEESLSE